MMVTPGRVPWRGGVSDEGPGSPGTWTWRQKRSSRKVPMAPCTCPASENAPLTADASASSEGISLSTRREGVDGGGRLSLSALRGVSGSPAVLSTSRWRRQERWREGRKGKQPCGRHSCRKSSAFFVSVRARPLAPLWLKMDLKSDRWAATWLMCPSSRMSAMRHPSGPWTIT